MDDELKRYEIGLDIVDHLRDYINDDDLCDGMHTDLYDLVEASLWLLAEMSKYREYPLTTDSAQDFLISLDINYVQHVTYHLNSLRATIEKTLGNIARLSPDDD